MRAQLNAITEKIIGCAIAVHEALGPGLLEGAYEACLAFELLEHGHSIEQQKPLPVVYRGKTVDRGYRLDLLVDELVIVEIKAIEKLHRVHRAQMLSYLRMTGCKVGLVINFNVRLLARDGVQRVVNNFPD